MAESTENDNTLIDERLHVKFTTQSKRFVCIEYPGYVKNIDKVLKTLESEEKVDAILKDPLRRVGLQFRPNDPYCRQGFGDRFPVTDLLMKVKRKKRKKNGTSDIEDVKYECEVLGLIDTVVKFKGLADFQYLAPEIPDLLDGLQGSELLDRETTLHIPPPAFCRIDRPFDYRYQSDPVRKEGAAQTTEQLGVSSRKHRPSHVRSCHFHTPNVPSKPKEEALEEVKRLMNNEGLETLQKLFNTRPIWSRRAVTYHLGEKSHRVKMLLSCVAYYWIGGPWRTLYAKFGYDPRKNPAAKIYQRLDFRLRSKHALRNLKVPPAATVRTGKHFSHYARPPSKTLSVPVVPMGVTCEKSATSSEKPGTSFENSAQNSENSIVNSEISTPDAGNVTGSQEYLPYVFYPDQPPVTRQIIYQICDIRCAEVQKLISANDGQERECNENEGWLEPGTSDKIRAVLTNTLIELNKVQQAAGDTTDAVIEEPSGEIEEAEAMFLDTLMDDDEVETYDLLDDDF